jgi:tetratricopeptide (TPR) repeat protein
MKLQRYRLVASLIFGLSLAALGGWKQKAVAAAGQPTVSPAGPSNPGARTGATQLAPLQQSAPPSAGDNLASQSVEADVAGDHDKALKLADDAIKSDSKNAWARYDRGDALSTLRRPDDAIVAFREAEQRFSKAEVWGKSIAIWGQANVLIQVGRCAEASPIFERYASLVEKLDKGAAELAREYSRRCSPRRAAP